MEKKSTGFEDFAIVTVWRNAYEIPFWLISKVEEVSRMKNANLREKVGSFDMNKKITYCSNGKNIHERLRLKLKDIIKKTGGKWLEKGPQYYKEKNLEEKKVIILYF